MVREKEIDLERYREETKHEATTFEVERVRLEQIEMLSGCNLQQLLLIKQILQLQLQLEDETGPTDGPKQATTTQNRLGATIRRMNN